MRAEVDRKVTSMKRFQRLTITACALAAVSLVGPGSRGRIKAQSRTPAPSKAVISGPVGPSPYDIVRGWHKSFAEQGYAFGGYSGLFAESPNRIFVALLTICVLGFLVDRLFRIAVDHMLSRYMSYIAMT